MNIREKRALLGWTQTDLAKAAGVRAETICRTELGKTKLRPSNEQRIHEVLDRELRQRAADGYLTVERVKSAYDEIMERRQEVSE